MMIPIDRAVEILMTSRRISVIGCSGGGKTTLSRALSRELDLPHISMDRDFYWLPGWRKRDKAEEQALISDAVKRERWIMDGTGSSSFHLRLPKTDLVLWVRVPRHICIGNVLLRVARYWGRERPDMAPGCPEKIDFELLRYIWTFEKKVSPVIEQRLLQYGPDVPVFQMKSRAEMHRLLDLLSDRS